MKWGMEMKKIRNKRKRETKKLGQVVKKTMDPDLNSSAAGGAVIPKQEQEPYFFILFRV